MIVIKADLSFFFVTMHSGLCAQYVQSQGLTALELDFLFVCTFVLCDNEPLQNVS